MNETRHTIVRETERFREIVIATVPCSTLPENKSGKGSQGKKRGVNHEHHR
jgi:hypothetical protein